MDHEFTENQIAETVCTDQGISCMQQYADSSRIQHSIEMIAEGQIPDSIEQLMALGRGIIRVNALGAQTLAVIVHAARIYFDRTDDLDKWISWCATELNLTDCSYRSHLLDIGRMLNGLHKCGMQHYKKVFRIAYNKQVVLTVLYKDKKYGVNALINFMKSIYRDEWSREELMEQRDLLMKRPVRAQGKDSEMVQPEFSFSFDAVGSMLQAETLLKLTSSESYDDTCALAMIWNGKELCKAALPKLEEVSGDLEIEDLEDLERDMTAFCDRVRMLVNARKKSL